MSAPLDNSTPPAPIIHPLPDTHSFNTRLQELLNRYFYWCAVQYSKERQSDAQIMEQAALPAIQG
jgi:hypothetical protein